MFILEAKLATLLINKTKNMKKFNLIYTLIISGFLITSCSQSKFIVAPPFTDAEKISKIEKGQTKDDVNKILGITPYDVLYLKDGDYIFSYNYRLMDRRIQIDNRNKNIKQDSATVASEKAQTFGKPFYTEWRKVYVNFKDNKLTNYVTDAGLEDAHYIQLVNGTISLLNKTDLEIDNFYLRNNANYFGSNDININTDGTNGNMDCCPAEDKRLDLDRLFYQLKYNGKFKENNQPRKKKRVNLKF